jgi:hypothetical protein
MAAVTPGSANDQMVRAEFLRRQTALQREATQASKEAAQATKDNATYTKQTARYMLWTVLVLAASVTASRPGTGGAILMVGTWTTCV